MTYCSCQFQSDNFSCGLNSPRRCIIEKLSRQNDRKWSMEEKWFVAQTLWESSTVTHLVDGVGGSDVGQINKVTLRQAQLILGWVTISGSTPVAGNLSHSNQPPRSTQPDYPSMGRHNEYQPKGDNALWLGVKAGMARVWWQVKLCEPLYNMCHIWAL